MQSKHRIISVLIALFLFIGCADNPTHPALTESEIEAIIDARIAEELAKMNGDADKTLTPQDIRQIALDAIASVDKTPVEIAENALQSTVFLRIKTPHKNYIGSGFAISKGLIATCNHVLQGMISATAEPVLHNRQYTITEVVAVDEKHDIAIIRALDFNMPALPLGDSDDVNIGDKIYMVSTPVKHLYKGSFVSGLVSGMRDDPDHAIEDVMFQTTLPSDGGSSGGAVLNEFGKVVGIHEGLDRDGTLIRFAIPSNHLQNLLFTIR